MKAVRCGAAVGAIGVAGYAAWAGAAWLRYGRAKPGRRENADALLDRFMPAYEVVERHQIRVAAPAEVTMAAACELNLEQSLLIRALFRTRERIMCTPQPQAPIPRTLLAMAKAIGWGILAEIPGREIVVGAVTQPWVGDVVFHPIPAEQFAAFHEPGWVKIAWTIRADRVNDYQAMARTETRVMTTDPVARAKFRRYWAFVSAGIPLIRRSALRMVKRQAELRNEIAYSRLV